MTTTTHDMLSAHLDALADDLAQIWAGIDADAWLCTDCGEPEDDHDPDDLTHDYSASEHADQGEPTDALEGLPLEIVYEIGEPFAVVLTTGGPHVELTGGGRSDGYVLAGHWSGTTAYRRSAAITRTGVYFRELCSEVAA